MKREFILPNYVIVIQPSYGPRSSNAIAAKTDWENAMLQKPLHVIIAPSISRDVCLMERSSGLVLQGHDRPESLSGDRCRTKGIKCNVKDNNACDKCIKAKSKCVFHGKVLRGIRNVLQINREELQC